MFLSGYLILFQTSAQCLPGFSYRIGDDESSNACAKVVTYSVVVTDILVMGHLSSYGLGALLVNGLLLSGLLV